MFGYLNENQVAIGESTIGVVRKLENQTPTPAFDITMLTIIAMERATTAREAIKIMGELAEKYGYGFHDSGEMLAIADPNEVWIFEIMPVGPLWTPKSGKPGAVWCAQRVPDDEVSVCPNESRIGEIDLNRPDYFMASPNVISCAVENGLYDPKSGQPFNWKKAYSPINESAQSSQGRYQRLWRFFDLVAPSLKLSPSTPTWIFPFRLNLTGSSQLKTLSTLPGIEVMGRHMIQPLAFAVAPSKIPIITVKPGLSVIAGLNTRQSLRVGAGCPILSVGWSGYLWLAGYRLLHCLFMLV